MCLTTFCQHVSCNIPLLNPCRHKRERGVCYRKRTHQPGGRRKWCTQHAREKNRRLCQQRYQRVKQESKARMAEQRSRLLEGLEKSDLRTGSEQAIEQIKSPDVSTQPQSELENGAGIEFEISVSPRYGHSFDADLVNESPSLLISPKHERSSDYFSVDSHLQDHDVLEDSSPVPDDIQSTFVPGRPDLSTVFQC